MHLSGPAFSALAKGDLAAATAVSPVPPSPYLAGPECHGVWQRRSEQYDHDPSSAAWVTGIVWDEQQSLAVGAAGFHGPPDSDGMVEIGYRIDPRHRRRGFARAALEALLARAAREPDVRRVRVSIRPDNLPSSGLALQYGFRQVGEQWDDEDGLELVYEVPAGDALAGGFVGDAVRVGDTVRKAPPRDPDFVHRLLRHFEERQWAGAPRFLGTDDRGRDMLGFIDGTVPARPGQEIRSERSLVAVARLVREFHDLTAGTDLAGGHEVVCHNDLSPKNTVYRESLPVAFVDWDIAAPGERIHDVAHVCWQYVGLGPAVPDAAEAARLVRVIADAYGLADRTALVDTIMWWQDRCWRGIDAAAEAGEPAMVRLRERGTVEDVRAAYDWTSDHRDVLRQ
ncbi:GNAT family N-acetyltransferase [Actinoplanes sp. NPDC051411]|uniref:GNAT family N-acetyltransferase n=1 Tax=Actinoplanes sp. NPDC051411 TaxID=3155522 RepID=UPI003430554F